MGRDAQVTANGGIALGVEASAANNGVAIGVGAAGTGANSVAFGTGAAASQTNSVAIGIGSSASDAASVALGSGATTAAAVGTSSIVVNGVSYSFAGASPIGTVSIGTSGSVRTLTNLAAGRLAASSTDAVNGSQLFATNQAVDALGTGVDNLGRSAAAAFGGGATYNSDGTISTPIYIIQGGSYSSVGDAFDAVNNNLTSLNNAIGDINNGAGITYFRANSNLPDSQASGTDSVAIGPASVASGASSFAAGNGATASGVGAVAIGEGASASDANSVALGAGATTAEAVGTASGEIRGKTYAFAGGAPVGTVSVGSEGAERTITNVAAGRLNAESTDAVNGSQLYATHQAIENLGAGVGELDEFAVKYDKNADGTRANSVTLQGGDPNAPVVLANVATGTQDNHAANVGQLKEGLQATLTESKTYTDNRANWAVETSNGYTDQVAASTLKEANAYTDQRLEKLSTDIGGARSEARQAAAIGLAASSLRYDERPGKTSMAIGGGQWRGTGALSFGIGHTSESQRVRANLSATTAGGHWGVGAGFGFTFE